MSILITGITSGVGYFVAKQLREKNSKLEIKATFRSKNPPDNLEDLDLNFVKGDLTKKDTLVEALKDVKTVFHVAGEAREDVSDELYFQINYEGTRNLLEAFVENNCERFLHVSTVGIYGYKLPSYPIKEDHPKKSYNAYHESKWIGEKEVFKQAREHGFFASAVRPPYIVGPRDRQMGPKLFEFLLKDKKIPLINNGKANLSFVHYVDLAEAMIKCSEKEEANGEAFHVIGDSISAKELFETIGKICNKKPNFFKINYQVAYGIGLISEIIAKIKRSSPKLTTRRVNQFSRSRMYDISKIDELVGFKPTYSVRAALEDAYNWMKEVNFV
ncbi:MAG: NAD(P)-dependent oxidoreductase [Candidatus Heimdallarchaeota archaeon]|nr:NAD(P)-dependent oxidoreductase [Candidatus Heimdallarchaeota archaeon]MCK4954027.1 NAD(P)-dependent oxidoreductase [Candidatus Heimdallarchaeota archaeon]